MNSDRIRQLELFLHETPDDPFLLYALALEYLRVNPEKAAGLFTRLLDEFPDYLPTYYQAAGFAAARGETENAASIYLRGIALAQLQKDPLALRELQTAYNQFLFEEDDD